MSPLARRTLLGLAALSGVVLVGLPPVLGTPSEAAYRENLRNATAALPPGWVLTEHYERGWFSAHATAELTPPPQTAARGRIRLDSRIEQGPWSWFGPGPWPALARIHTRADWVDGDLTLPPLLLDTVIGLRRAGETRLLVPASESPAGTAGPRVQNAEIRGLARFREDTREVLLDLEAPGVTLLDPAGTVADLRGARLQARLQGGVAGRNTGTLTLTVDAAEAGAPVSAGSDAAPLRLEGLRMTLDQTASRSATATTQTGTGTGSGTSTRLDLRLDATAERLRLGGTDNRSAVLGFSARSLDPQALAELSRAVGTMTSEQAPPAMRGLAGVSIATQLLPRFLASGPGIVLDPLTLVTPDGPASARLALAANGQGGLANGAAALLGALLNRNRNGNGILIGIEGDAALDLPESLARSWLRILEPQSGSQGSGSQGSGSTGPDPWADWVQNGWVSQQGGRLTSNLRLADGQLSINGRPVALRLPGLGR